MNRFLIANAVPVAALVVLAAPPTAAAQTAEGESAPAPEAANVAPAAAPAAPETSDRAREWQLELGVGGEFFVFLNSVVGNGPALRLAAEKVGWFGHFLVGGGPSFEYVFLTESDALKDKIHQVTLDGDFLIGGGSFEKFALYFHLMLGFGVVNIYDAESDDELWMFWGRAMGGVGGWVHLTPLVSLGALVDVGFPGVIDGMLTLGFHVGRE